MLDDRGMRDAMGTASRNRIVSGFTKEQQLNHLIETITKVVSRKGYGS